MIKVFSFYLFISWLLLTTTATNSQDVHYADVNDMKIWYNPALKIDKIPLARVCFRNVKYPNIISYSSKAIMFDLPFVGKDKTDYNNIPFVNLSIGINTDNSSDGYLKASTVLGALSYALPLNENNTYISFGCQANYSFNKVGNDLTYQFPNNFDKYGALRWALVIDPYTSGLNYEYFTLGAGVSLFHDGDEQQWYIGGSVRHFNHPYTEWSHSAQLPSNNGIQAGLLTKISLLTNISFFTNLNWQVGTNEKSIGMQLYRKFNDTTNNSISLGLCYRATDGLVLNVGVQIQRIHATFYYELPMNQINVTNYHRRASGFSFQYDL